MINSFPFCPLLIIMSSSKTLPEVNFFTLLTREEQKAIVKVLRQSMDLKYCTYDRDVKRKFMKYDPAFRAIRVLKNSIIE